MRPDGLAGIVGDEADISAAERSAVVSGMPTESWWIGLDRHAFSERARAEMTRMRLSRYGRVDRLATSATVEPPGRRKSLGRDL